MIRKRSIAGVALLAAFGTSGITAPKMSRYKVLVYALPDGKGHPSSAIAAMLLPQWAAQRGIVADVARDPSVMTTEKLREYRAVIFASANGDRFNAEQRLAFEGFVRGGGGVVGSHAALGGKDWPFYKALFGDIKDIGHTTAYAWITPQPDTIAVNTTPQAYRGPASDRPAEAESASGFSGRPDSWMVSWTPAYLTVENHRTPIMRSLAPSHFRREEWHAFDKSPRPRVHVLASVDERTYDSTGTSMGVDHPVIWCLNYSGARVIYSALGHRSATWRNDTAFREHIMNAITTAAGEGRFDCKPGNRPPPQNPLFEIKG